MKVSTIKNFEYNNNKVSFQENKIFLIEDKNGVKNHVDMLINDVFETEKTKNIDVIAQKTLKNLENNWFTSIANVQRYKTAINKTEIFTKLARTFHSAQKYELAATTFALALNCAEKDSKFESDRKKYNSLINNINNIEILKDFFAMSSNNKTKFYVMKAINEYNSPYFLPVAEDILEFHNDTVLYSDKKTTYMARLYLHNFYNFNLLNNAATKSQVHQNAALNIIKKWGTEQDIMIVNKIEKNAANNQITAKCKLIEQYLNDLDKAQDFMQDKKESNIQKVKRLNKDFDEILNEIFVDLNTDAIVNLKQYKYPSGSFNATKLIERMKDISNPEHKIELIRFIGQTSAFVKHMEYVKPDNDISKLNNEKAEAYYKIMLRTNFSG